VSCRAAGGWLLASFQHDVSRMPNAISFLLVVVVVVVPVVLAASYLLAPYVLNGLKRR
jgi:hypothetical protein